MAQRSTVDFDNGTLSVQTGGPGFGRKAGKNIQQSAFDLEMIKLGATNEERRKLNDQINKLVELAEVKTDGSADKIQLLKKVEIAFHNLVEKRVVFDFFDREKLLEKEKARKVKDAAEKTKNNIQQEQKEDDDKKKKIQKRIENKKNLVVASSVRTTFRSKKPPVNVQKVVTKKPLQSVLDMQKFLGISPEDWGLLDDASESAAKIGKDSSADVSNAQ